MLRSEGMCCRFWRVANWCEYCRVCTKRQYLGCLPEPLYRSMKLRVCVEFLAAWCQQRLGKPDEGYQVM